ncbi:MAG TPA: sensor histidine kinase [Aggregatilineales bacterium]|nr:sensor histidine kinase [Anaerolineales bacterium]HRE49684.1 sensor histidine kinase [Aggregatilineales bacterium]
MSLKQKRLPETTLFHRIILISVAVQFFWFLLGERLLYWESKGWQPDQVILFAALFGVHFGLHVVARRLSHNPLAVIAYLIVQSVLIYTLSMVGRSGQLREWLYLPLLGEMLLYTKTLWFAVLAAAIMFGFDIVQGYISFGVAYADRLVVTISWWSVWWFIGQAPYVSALLLQVRGRRQISAMLTELESAHRRLTEYAVQIEKLTLTSERARMARELHDTLSQGLTGTILQLEALEAYVEIGDVPKAVSIATQVKKRARSALADSRRAIDDLRQQTPERLSLLEMIEHEIKRFAEATSITYTLDLPPSFFVPYEIGEHVLRCISEGLSNIARHAHATHVSLTVSQNEDMLHIQLSDDGVGFDVDMAAQKIGHYGLLGMRERARLLGGIFEIYSKLGIGTMIDLSLKVV